jgi:hypothetical protein
MRRAVSIEKALERERERETVFFLTISPLLGSAEYRDERERECDIRYGRAH